MAVGPDSMKGADINFYFDPLCAFAWIGKDVGTRSPASAALGTAFFTARPPGRRPQAAARAVRAGLTAAVVDGLGLDLVSMETNWETSKPGDKESAR
jgi:hypothetical protein